MNCTAVGNILKAYCVIDSEIFDLGIIQGTITIELIN